METAKKNADAYPWAAAMRDELVSAAAPWLAMPDEDLWELPFACTINRSWMVWSDGFCPECKKDVRMYTWEMDPFNAPWKVRCPHCKTQFPKNDFAAYYRSGMDEHHAFDPARADRSLLFNPEHPDAADPLRGYGVDDGEGYVDAEGYRWRFIGAYLIYGQWKKMIVAGASSLAQAYMVTGNAEYARKALILLDRVADFYDSYDYAKQGWVYERQKGAQGQVSVWHDACVEVCDLAHAYDQVFDAAAGLEQPLTAFLSAKAAAYKLTNPKSTWKDIQANIETGILRSTLNHRERIESNYPNTDLTIITIKAILDWPTCRDDVMLQLGDVIKKATAVDGLSGEKGLAGYSTIAPRTLAYLLAKLSRLEPGFIKTTYEKYPVLLSTFRFHLDTWCLDGKYYPAIGDAGQFGLQYPNYGAVPFSTNPGVNPSMYEFMWDLYDATQDPAFVQVMYRANGGKTEGMPHTIFAADPPAFEAGVKRMIDVTGPEIYFGSVNKPNWHLALLRSGKGGNERAFWMDYDAAGNHCHLDGLNIGLFAKGLDLMPDFGYPPVGYGGWDSPKARWYINTGSHNTVLIDGKNHIRANGGEVTLWANGQNLRAVRASNPGLTETAKFERLTAMFDVNESDSYLVDVFCATGGTDHAKFFRSSLGSVETTGLNLTPGEDYGHETEMKNFRTDPAPTDAWSVDWNIEDRRKYLPEGQNVHLKYTDLTQHASASLADSWIAAGLYGTTGEEYIPTVMVRRKSQDNSVLNSTFVSVIEPYATASNLAAIRRIPLQNRGAGALNEDSVGIEIRRTDNHRDIWIITDPKAGGEALEPVNGILVTAELAVVTLGDSGPQRIVMSKGNRISVGPLTLTLRSVVDLIEIEMGMDGAVVLTGSPGDIKDLTYQQDKIEILND